MAVPGRAIGAASPVDEHLAHGCQITNDGVGVDFLADFPFHAGKVGGEVFCQTIYGVDMAADAEAELVVQASLAAFVGAGIG